MGLFCIIDMILSGPCCHGNIPRKHPLEGSLAKLWPLQSLPALEFLPAYPQLPRLQT